MKNRTASASGCAVAAPRSSESVSPSEDVLAATDRPASSACSTNRRAPLSCFGSSANAAAPPLCNDSQGQSDHCPDLGDSRPVSPSQSDINRQAQAEGCCTPSKLDFFDPHSELARSPYRGFATLLFICSGFYLVANPIMRWYEKGEFVDPSLAVAMFYDFFYLGLWPPLFSHEGLYWKTHTVRTAASDTIHDNRLCGRPLLVQQVRFTPLISRPCAFDIPLFLFPSALGSAEDYKPQGAFLGGSNSTVCHCLARCPSTNTSIEPSICVAAFRVQVADNSSCVRAGCCSLQLHEGEVNLRNFCYYMVVPSLVYEPYFPRGNGFRPAYFVWKLVSLVSAMTVMYLACTSYLIPTISRSPSVSLMEAMSNLIFPFLFLDLLIFFILFECICNLLAEVTNFGNRDFYHFSQQSAVVATFLFSALLHEMIVAVCFRFIRFYLLLLMLFQIPLVALGRYYAHNRCLANAIFWACMLLGLPLLAVAYGREFAQEHFYTENKGWQELRAVGYSTVTLVWKQKVLAHGSDAEFMGKWDVHQSRSNGALDVDCSGPASCRMILTQGAPKLRPVLLTRCFAEFSGEDDPRLSRSWQYAVFATKRTRLTTRSDMSRQTLSPNRIESELRGYKVIWGMVEQLRMAASNLLAVDRAPNVHGAHAPSTGSQRL
ncbi:uncharacterized protein LOC34619659 [Cyclospora cayetanensis]|uniref:Uncharacterized protein LOC34619659 n=1 Tax=Cyclospora cayetanensis TaxID=88456 RepID=A0A6P6RQ45_9EIME|nr:uncharacterized protein LOC34619659 [Cyclospora cayetanensis]